MLANAVRTLDNTNDDDLFTLEEIAIILGCSVWTVRRTAMAQLGLRPSLYVGRSPRFRKREFIAWLNRQISGKRFAEMPRPKTRPKTRKPRKK